MYGANAPVRLLSPTINWCAELLTSLESCVPAPRARPPHLGRGAPDGRPVGTPQTPLLLLAILLLAGLGLVLHEEGRPTPNPESKGQSYSPRQHHHLHARLKVFLTYSDGYPIRAMPLTLSRWRHEGPHANFATSSTKRVSLTHTPHGEEREKNSRRPEEHQPELEGCVWIQYGVGGSTRQMLLALAAALVHHLRHSAPLAPLPPLPLAQRAAFEMSFFGPFICPRTHGSI